MYCWGDPGPNTYKKSYAEGIEVITDKCSDAFLIYASSQRQRNSNFKPYIR